MLQLPAIICATLGWPLPSVVFLPLFGYLSCGIAFLLASGKFYCVTAQESMAKVCLFFPAFLFVSDFLCVCVKEQGGFFRARCAFGSVTGLLLSNEKGTIEG